MGFEKDVRKLLERATKLNGFPLEKPKADFGDLAFPCFILAKDWKKAPPLIAEALVKDLRPKGRIEKITAAGPYINFFMKKGDFAKDVIHDIKRRGKEYGSSRKGNGKKLLIEHTSINPNASPHVGRARNAIIGDSIARIMAFQGYKVDRHFFVNDIGKQIALLVLGASQKPSFDKLLSIYIKANEELKAHPEKEKEVFALLHQLENSNVSVRKKFREIVDICVKGQEAILNDFGITYDAFDYESDYLFSKDTDKVLKDLEKTGKIFVDDDKRKVLDLKDYKLPMKSPVFVLTRGDGTSLYGLRDIAYNLMKIKMANKNIVVLGEDQKLYHQQIIAALDLLGKKAPESIHYSFILLSDGKMSTRKGNVVLLEDFMKEAKHKARLEIKKRGYSDNIDENARSIGYGAVKYAILKVSPD
ncbi:MAG: arginine--tRNA ligase, partial [Nanoarchaeota archaeon]